MSEVAEIEKPRTFLDNAVEEAKKVKAVKASEKVFYDVEPLNKWVLLRKIERVQTTIEVEEGKELITKVDEERSSVGIVLAISPLCKQGLQIGDRVIYTNYAITLEDLEEATGDPMNFIVREEEVFCRLHERKKEVS